MSEEYTHPTLDKIGSLRAKFKDPAYPADLEQITSWEVLAKDLIARQELAENEVLQNVCREYQVTIAALNERFMTEDSARLPADERDRLLDKRDMYEDFVKRFNVEEIARELAIVDKSVQDELNTFDS